MFAPTPLVSVVMAVFNGSAYLGQAIESVLCQSHASFELIVVDEASTKKHWFIPHTQKIQTSND